MNYETKPKWTKFIGYALNLAIFFMVLFLTGSLVKNYLSSNSNDSAKVKATEGDKISFPEIEWKQNTKTVFLFLYSQCVHCVNSKSFYRRLAEETSGKDNVKLVVVFPIQDKKSEQFAQEVFSTPPENRKIDFAAVGVFDTPTIILTDDSGTISKIWKGELARMEELNVFNALGLETAQTDSDWYINEKDLDKLARKESVSIIDLREREIYKEGHLPKAINIPLDELPVRAVNELDLANTIALYGNASDKKKIESVVKVLNNQGYKRVLIINKTVSRKDNLKTEPFAK